jgi:hypothetical protein
MRMTVRTIAALAVGAILVAGCGDDGDAKSNTDAVATTVAAAGSPTATTAAAASGGTAPLKIDSAKGPLTIDAPAGATSKVVAGTLEVVAGNTFHLELVSGIGTVSRYKEDIDANTINKVKRYVVDTPAGILYESVLAGKSEYHIYVVVKVLGGIICTDSKGPAYTQAQAQAMYDACLSARA